MTERLTPRDQAVIHAAWSLGLATAATLRALVAPTAAPSTFRIRLHTLHRARYLDQVHLPGNRGHLWLYGAARRGLPESASRSWRPGLAQLGHTLAVADVLVATTRDGFASPAVLTGWQGEAELRAWAPPGAPYPDARVMWRHDNRIGAWLIELDRATETRPAWRRKLVRYLTIHTADQLLVITTSWQRAANLAALAADTGVPALLTTTTELNVSNDPAVLDTMARARVHISQTLRST
ncbi:MAG: hypothetical protein QOG53_3166 [Frankiales bacterium]|nr:hypothetical protein [Frankiales bacterium]